MKTQQYFTNCTTLDTLTKERNRLAKLYHPDLGGDVRVMQEINAQFEAAKKRLSAPPASRTYACPRDPWKDLYEQATRQAQQWAADIQQQQREQERQDRERYREQVKTQEAKLKEGVEWVLSRMRLARCHGYLEGCEAKGNKERTVLFVMGSTRWYSRWFTYHGFQWDQANWRWEFTGKPKNFNEEVSDGWDYDFTDIPF